MTQPIVALVGRPNVGKSTLFNRLAGERLAVVAETPGTTRDRLIAESEWRGHTFTLVDTGGIDPTSLRSGAPLSIDSADYIEGIRAQAETAARDADAILFLVDVESGPTAADREVADILRRQARDRSNGGPPPIKLVVNKCDNRSRREEAVAFYELGLGEPHPISALHGRGIGDLLDKIVESLSPWPEPETTQDDSVGIAIVGRPNVGKSSLLNQLLGEDRVLVSSIPGTTRDAVDTKLVFQGHPVTLIDTAGIRRRGKVEPGVEKYSVIRTLKAVDRADVVLVLIDASEGVTAQDAHIAGMAFEKWKSVVVLVNKWDLAPDKEGAMDSFAGHVQSRLKFLAHVPVIFISALTGEQVEGVLPTALQVQEERLRRIPTGEFNRLLQESMAKHPPPTHSGKQLKIYYGSQVSTDPPT
ncbi:MAG: ribosome biogenesis GTPase Der, partial [Anaerolineales bacterium]|nr:ribosome biogenesis GTPase Der [Anaerolineales bacterium]